MKLCGAVNMTSPNPVKNNEFTKFFAASLGRRPFIPVPKFLLKSLAGEASQLFLQSQRVIPKKLISSGYKFRHIDLLAVFRTLIETKNAQKF
jgi:NAD dependent epimerase/dehydratase family enzyme